MSETQVCLAGRSVKENITGSNYNAEVLLDGTNRRIKIISYQGSNLASLTSKLTSLAWERELGKIIFLAPEDYRYQAQQSGYILEGEIPGFFNGRSALCYSFYIDGMRSKSEHIADEDRIIQEVTGYKESSNTQSGNTEYRVPRGYQLREVQEQEVDKLVSLYQRVFASYPSPLFDPDYVWKVMQENVYFLAVYKGNDLLSAGSAEIDFSNSNAEITDLATDQKARGLGFATTIITALEKEMCQRKLTSLYSLARARIPSVNRVFHKLGYKYRGRLLNNCHIDGSFEDMNLWVKQCVE